ncbi:MAG: DUF2510 domain-containing protein [Acidimicrobiia bacterium]
MTTRQLHLPAPQWAPDPSGRHALRWWDGTTWTTSTRDAAGVVTDDPHALGPAARPPRLTRPRWPLRADLAMGLAVVALLSSPTAFMALTGSMDQPDAVVHDAMTTAVVCMVLGAVCLISSLVLALWGGHGRAWASPDSFETFLNRFVVVWGFAVFAALPLWFLIIGG